MQITLKAARMNKQLTQRDAAAKIGVTSDTIGNWERGKSFPDAMQIKRIEEVYKVRYDDLIFLPNKTL
jgi:putative transcriptional regulator